MQSVPTLQLAVAAAVGGALLWVLWPKKVEAKKLNSVLLVGDSLGVGLGPPLKDELKPAKLVTRAYVSANARDWAYGKYKKDLVELLQSKPDTVLISLGTNDTAPPPGELSDKLPFHFKMIVDLVRAAGGTPIFIEPPALLWSDQRVIEAAALSGARLIKTPGGLAHAPDNIHLTLSGYETWAKLVAQELRGHATVGHPIEAFVPSPSSS